MGWDVLSGVDAEVGRGIGDWVISGVRVDIYVSDSGDGEEFEL